MPKRRSYTLAGLFGAITVLGVWLAAGRVFGFAAVSLFTLAPMPLAAFAWAVWITLRPFQAEYRRGSAVSSCILLAAFVVAGLTTLMTLSAALAALQ